MIKYFVFMFIVSVCELKKRGYCKRREGYIKIEDEKLENWMLFYGKGRHDK